MCFFSDGCKKTQEYISFHNFTQTKAGYSQNSFPFENSFRKWYHKNIEG